MRIIRKKSYSKLFEKVLSGEKTFDMRVADFDVRPGDILEQIEVGHDGVPTGRKVRHVVGEVLRTKDIEFWSAEDIERYGYQVMSLLSLPREAEDDEERGCSHGDTVRE